MARTSREMENRTNEMREVYETDYISPLSVPEAVKRDGYSYAWVRKDIRGQEDFRVEEMAAKGWTLVPADRAPGIALDPLERNPLSRKYLCYKDLILMERPEVYSKQETARFNKMNAEKIKSLRGVSNDIGSFSKPLTSINSF